MADNKESTKITRKDIHDKLWEARDFEISHLWQRSIFLATFIVLLFTAYFSVLDKAIDNKKEYNEYSYELSTGNTLRTNTSVISYEEENLSNKEHMTTIILEGICLMGFSFSTLWVCMARGSKYMYERIENGINTTYDDLDAWDPSVRTKIEKEYCDCLWNLGDYTWMPRHGAQPLSRYNYKPLSTDGSTFSPSKINIIIGYVFIFAWEVLIILPKFLFSPCNNIISISLLSTILIFVLISYWSLSGRYKNVWAFIHSLFLAIHHNDRTPERNQIEWIKKFLTLYCSKASKFPPDANNTEVEVYKVMKNILQQYRTRCENCYSKKTITSFLSDKPCKYKIINMISQEQLKQFFEISLMPRNYFNSKIRGTWKSLNYPFYSVQINLNIIRLDFIARDKTLKIDDCLSCSQFSTKLFADTDWNEIRSGNTNYSLIEGTKVFRIISKNIREETTYIVLDISKPFLQEFNSFKQSETTMKMTYRIYDNKGEKIIDKNFIFQKIYPPLI